MPAESAVPAGFHSVTPRIVVSDAAAAVEFLRAVFHASGDAPLNRPAEIRIGDSVVMVSEAGERETFPAFLYVYVDDADTTYQRAHRRRRGQCGETLGHAIRRPQGDGA